VSLHVSSSNFISDAAGPAASANTVFRVSSTEVDSTLLIGASDTGSYISSFSKSNFATERNLILNAKGGNVGIGSASPKSFLDIMGLFNFRSGAGGTSNNWLSTGINMNGGTAGGAVLFFYTLNNSGGDVTVSHLYFLRKSHSSASTVWVHDDSHVYQLSKLYEGVLTANVGFRVDASGVLECRTSIAGNGLFYAIELH